jgi:AcrR family transcriptional regulator
MGSKRTTVQPSADCPRTLGRPRSERARCAILNSTLKFFESRQNGYVDLTIEEVAARAAVGKATVYRWWPNKAALVADAFAFGATQKLHFPDTGSLLNDMTQQMQQLVKILRGRRGHAVSVILGAGQSEPTLLTAFRERFIRPRRADATMTVQRGIQRGELPANVDIEHLLDALYGPLYFRFLVRHSELTPEFVKSHCRLVLEQVMPAAKPNGKIAPSGKTAKPAK